MSRLSELLAHLEAKADQLDRRLRSGAHLPLSAICPGPHQPRRRLEGIEDLARSVREKGLLQPLLVRPLEDGRYEIVAGERRYRAAVAAGLSEVPAVVLQVSQEEARALALVENLKREDLSPYEETVALLDLLALRQGVGREAAARLLQKLLQAEKRKSGLSHDVVGQLEAVEEVFRTAARMDWRSFVQHRLPLLRLPDELRSALEEGSIPYSAALELRKVKDGRARKALLEEAKAGLPVHELRRRVRALGKEREKQQESELHERFKALFPRLKALPPERKKEAMRYLEALEALLEGQR
jgi:ParB family chromosome partitioning protein